MGFLFLPVLLVRVYLERIGIIKPKRLRTDEERTKLTNMQFRQREGVINTVLSIFEKIERWFMKKERRVPFGSSIIVVARKE